MKKLVALALALVLCLSVTGAFAQGIYDGQRVRIVIGSTSVSGDSYMVAETVNQYLKKYLNCNSKVDAVGANEALGTIATAKPDGLTMMIFHDMTYLGVLFGAYDNMYALENMVPNSPQVKQVLFGENGAAQCLRKGAVVIDMSSINPIASREIAAELEKLGVEMLDAPVSGGEPKAIDGTLAFMVGGKEDVFEAHKKILEAMGSSVVLCGGIGAGNVTKLCNQMIVAVNIAVLAEALEMGQMAGVEPQKIFDAIKGGLAGSTVMNAKAPMMMDQNFKPGFRIDLHIKDLNNVMDAAAAVNAPTPLTSSVLEMMKNLRLHGDDKCDHSALLKYYQQMTGVTLHH